RTRLHRAVRADPPEPDQRHYRHEGHAQAGRCAGERAQGDLGLAGRAERDRAGLVTGRGPEGRQPTRSRHPVRADAAAVAGRPGKHPQGARTDARRAHAGSMEAAARRAQDPRVRGPEWWGSPRSKRLGRSSLMNLRTMSMLAGATLVTLTASRNAAGQAAQHPDLSGRWTYNAAQSNSLSDMLQSGDTSGGEQRRGGGGGRRGGFG